MKSPRKYILNQLLTVRWLASAFASGLVLQMLAFVASLVMFSASSIEPSGKAEFFYDDACLIIWRYRRHVPFRCVQFERVTTRFEYMQSLKTVKLLPYWVRVDHADRLNTHGAIPWTYAVGFGYPLVFGSFSVNQNNQMLVDGSFLRVAIARKQVELPSIVSMPSLVVDVLCSTTIVWMACLGLRLGRASSRRRRGCCAICGYPMLGGSQCTECGWIG